MPIDDPVKVGYAPEPLRRFYTSAGIFLITRF
jgi:hypothetical protein